MSDLVSKGLFGRNYIDCEKCHRLLYLNHHKFQNRSFIGMWECLLRWREAYFCYVCNYRRLDSGFLMRQWNKITMYTPFELS